ncbi:MAG: transcription antitermination factor NusB [Desulfovibrionaceae bacterium]
MNKAKNATRRSERALAFQVLYGLSFTPVTSIGALRHAFESSPDNADKRAEIVADELARFEAEKALNKDPNKVFEQKLYTRTVPKGFAWELVEGVWAHSAELDEIITKFSRNWRVDRMGRIELTVLRLGIFEMLYRTDIPPKVAINEALELAKEFGEENARSFINGILDATSKALDSKELEFRHSPSSPVNA